MICGTYFSTDLLCPLNQDKLFNAGHTCVAEPGHTGPHRCSCGAAKERKR